MKRLLLPALAATVLLFAALSLTVGPSAVSVGTALSDLIAGRDSTAAVIVAEIRLPRVLLATAVGASLGMAGAALQGWLRNPLAEPAVLGISGGAAFGAVATFYSGLAVTLPLALPLGGIAGALATVALLLALAGRDATVLTLVLAGMALSTLSGALISLALSLSPNPFALAEVVFWLLGSLSNRSLDHVALALPPMLLGLPLLLSCGRALDALTLGEEAAASLGFSLRRLRLSIVFGCALTVGAATAVTGVIGFVGLIVPHLLRPLIGHTPGRLLPASALAGAVLVLAADILVRLLSSTQELKLGVVTSLIGAPFFFALVIRARRTTP